MSGPKIVFGAPAPAFKLPDVTTKQPFNVTALAAAVAPPPPLKPIVAPPCGPNVPGKLNVPPALP